MRAFFLLQLRMWDQTVQDFKGFILKNNVLLVASAMTFGQATVALVKAFVADFMLPIVYMAAAFVTSRFGGNTDGAFFTRMLANKEFRFENFVAEIITFVLIIGVVFAFITYVMRKLVPEHSSAAPAAPGPDDNSGTSSIFVEAFGKAEPVAYEITGNHTNLDFPMGSSSVSR
jgi:large-conductance mechanosensitive channel